MKRLSIPSDIKPNIVWVEYGVCLSDNWWKIVGVAELQIKWGDN